MTPRSTLLYRFSKRRSRKNLYAWLHESIDSFQLEQKKLVLNIGAGGEVSDELARAGVKAVSIDVNSKRRPDIVASVEDMTLFEEGVADAIFCIELLEHVAHPHVATAEMFRVLRPGGIVIGSTPFLLGIHDDPYDYFRFTRHGLKRIFDAFEPISIRERNGYFAAIAVLIYRRFVVGTPRDRFRSLLLSPIFFGLAVCLELIDKLFALTDGTTGYFFIFRKPGSAS
jgi:SAM-dependent methyltransferase